MMFGFCVLQYLLFSVTDPGARVKPVGASDVSLLFIFIKCKILYPCFGFEIAEDFWSLWI